MKILFFIGSMRRGGAERVISILANHYAKKGWNVEIALLLDTDVQYPLDENIAIVNLNVGEGSYFKNLPKWILKIRSYVNKSRPDKIVSFIGRINMLVLTATLFTKIPIIVSERNDPKHDGRGKIIQYYCNWIYKRASKVVFQTEYERSCFSDNLKQSVIIPNPISVAMPPQKSQRLEFVTAGRLMPQKNQAMLIDAFVEIHKNYPLAALKIYGDGALKDELQNRIDAYKLNDVVHLCGNVIDLHDRIVGATAFILTSEYEGLSNALIEAMMLGIPCISTDYPGSEEIIQDGINGLIVPRQNVAALSVAIKKIIDNPKFCERIVDASLKKAECYKKEFVLQKWDEVIEG